jgi:hypothetical protein
VAYAGGLDLVDRYLELGLRLGRHVDGFVDYYYGPSALRERVDGEESADPAVLAGDAERLLAELADGDKIADEQRRRWLTSQLGGLRTAAQRLAGDAIPYVEEVERCYGVRVEHAPEERFAAAHRELDDALAGPGDLGERFRAWDESQYVPPESLLPVVRVLCDDFRARAERLLGLPEGESVELELVSDEPWAAYNYYLGGLRSRVVVNTDVPMRAARLAELVAHELYPGHHTEHALKEERLVRRRDYGEETIALIATPQSLVSEAIAEVALDVLLGEDAHEVVAEHVRPLGIDYEPERVARILRAREALESVPTNAALMLHQEGATYDDAHAYMSRWSLRAKPFVDKLLQFVTDPTWRAYVPCYSEGRRLGLAFVGGDAARFRRLVTEQLVPADLVAA